MKRAVVDAPPALSTRRQELAIAREVENLGGKLGVEVAGTQEGSLCESPRQRSASTQETSRGARNRVIVAERGKGPFRRVASLSFATSVRVQPQESSIDLQSLSFLLVKCEPELGRA